MIEATSSNDIKIQAIQHNRDEVITARTAYYTELVMFAIRQHKEYLNATDSHIKEAKLMVIEETIMMMSTAWKNTLPFNLFVSKNAASFAKHLGVHDLRNHDYGLKFSMETVKEQLNEPNFSTVADKLSEKEAAKLKKALSSQNKALNSNVMLHWEHAFTGKMFVTAVRTLINDFSKQEASDTDIHDAVHKLVKQQSVVWLLKTEDAVLLENGYKELREPNWETAYQKCGIQLWDLSKTDYNKAFGKEWDTQTM